MNRKILIKYLLFIFGGLVFSLLLLNAPEIGLCRDCYTIADIGQPISFFLLSLIPIFILFFFTHEKVFTTWKKFAIPYLVLSAIFLAIPDGGSGGFMGGGPDNEFFAFALSVIFLIISLILIAIKSWTLRRENKNT